MDDDISINHRRALHAYQSAASAARTALDDRKPIYASALATLALAAATLAAATVPAAPAPEPALPFPTAPKTTTNEGLFR